MRKCSRICAKQKAAIKISYIFESWLYIGAKEKSLFPNIHKDKIQEEKKRKKMCTKIFIVVLFSKIEKELETA